MKPKITSKRQELIQHLGLVRSIMKPATKTQPYLSALKVVVRSLIPPSFSWWIELDEDLVSVRWIWTGHSSVSIIGKVSDADASICVALLQQTDWDAEIDAAIATVENFEREALLSAQAHRKAKMLNKSGHLPHVSLPEPGPVTLEGKRERDREKRASELKAKKLRISFGPTAQEIANDSLGKTVRPMPPGLHGDIGDFALTKSFSKNPRSCVWAKFETYPELLHELYKNPKGTFTQAAMFGFRWMDEQIYGPTHWNIARQHISENHAKELSAEEFYKLLTAIVDDVTEDQ